MDTAIAMWRGGATSGRECLWGLKGGRRWQVLGGQCLFVLEEGVV